MTDVFELKGDLLPQDAKIGGLLQELHSSSNIRVDLYTRDTKRCVASCTVTAHYNYGGLRIIALLDNDEPLAWAMVLNDDETVTHFDRQYLVVVVC